MQLITFRAKPPKLMGNGDVYKINKAANIHMRIAVVTVRYPFKDGNTVSFSKGTNTTYELRYPIKFGSRKYIYGYQDEDKKFQMLGNIFDADNVVEALDRFKAILKEL